MHNEIGLENQNEVNKSKQVCRQMLSCSSSHYAYISDSYGYLLDLLE